MSDRRMVKVSKPLERYTSGVPVNSSAQSAPARRADSSVAATSRRAMPRPRARSATATLPMQCTDATAPSSSRRRFGNP